MNSDNDILHTVLKFLAGKSERICRLCFASTENSGLFLEECVQLKSYINNETVSYKDMLIRLTVSIYCIYEI